MGVKSWSEHLQEHKVLLVIVIVAFFVVELEVFVLATMRSGHQSYMQVMDESNEVVYEVKGSTMTNFNKYYFENTFGPFENYKVKLVSKDIPFPFRAWFSAAVGLPVGLILLLGFILKAVMTFIRGDAASFDSSDSSDSFGEPGEKGKQGTSGKIENIFFRISRFNIFIIGFLVFAAVFLYWIIPNLISFLARTGIETIVDFKWFFVAVVSALFVLFAWFMYMKYRLAHKSMEVQTEIRKYELQLEYKRTTRTVNSLDYDDSTTHKMLGYVEPSSEPEIELAVEPETDQQDKGKKNEDNNHPQGNGL